jgi:hypothetical protein
VAEKFNLPGSSFEELHKILKGYSHAPDNSSLDSLSKLTSLHPSVISRNNEFLTDINLINGGMKKTVTELGKKLGRALEHKQSEDAQKYWRESVQTNEKVSGLITAVRIKGSMTEKDFSDHILYVSGQMNNSSNKTGARCVVDVLMPAGLLQEADGKVTVAVPSSPPIVESDLPSIAFPEQDAPTTVVQTPMPAPTVPATAIPTGIPQIAINIQLHLPETDNADVYEKLFKALREHLILPKE